MTDSVKEKSLSLVACRELKIGHSQISSIQLKVIILDYLTTERSGNSSDY